MAGKNYKYVPQTTSTPFDAISTFYSEIESLAEEVREVVDNAAGTASESKQRIQTLDESADTLENLQERDQPELPDGVLNETVTVSIAINRRRSEGPSRAVRCENACAYGQAGIEAIRNWCDEQDDAASPGPKDDTVRERTNLVQDLRDYCDEIEGHINEAEDCEFPGMYS